MIAFQKKKKLYKENIDTTETQNVIIFLSH